VAGATHWTVEGHEARIPQLVYDGGWYEGCGRYATIACCNRLTVKRWSDVGAAQAALAWIDRLDCGHACERWHALLDLETGTYVGQPMLERFCQRSPPVVDITSRDRAVVRRLERGWRQVLFPAATIGMPWLAYVPHPTTWTIDYSDGTYRDYDQWRSQLDDLGLTHVMQWIFYEVAARIPPRPAGRMTLVGGQHWYACPSAVAPALVGSLHALLWRVVAQCERHHVRQRYLDTHPQAPCWDGWTAAELCDATDDDLGHDAWCAWR
jgi:hypothetical protein